MRVLNKLIGILITILGLVIISLLSLMIFSIVFYLNEDNNNLLIVNNIISDVLWVAWFDTLAIGIVGMLLDREKRKQIKEQEKEWAKQCPYFVEKDENDKSV